MTDDDSGCSEDSGGSEDGDAELGQAPSSSPEQEKFLQQHFETLADAPCTGNGVGGTGGGSAWVPWILLDADPPGLALQRGSRAP